MATNRKKIPEVVWMRVGDEDSYHSFDTVEDAAQYLGEFYGTQQITRKHQSGVTTAGFEGNNYISLYWGTDPKDGSAEMSRALTEEEISQFNLSLEAIVDCENADAREPTAIHSEQDLLDCNDTAPLLCPISTTPSSTFQYVVEIMQPSHGTTFYRIDNGIHEKDQSKATRFNGYLLALQHITGVLAHIVLNEPAEIRIVLAPNNGPWTVEEILAREG
jgi:hypothetical protein